MLLPHRELAIAVVGRTTGDPAEAEDCVHEAMLRVVRRDAVDPAHARPLLVRAALRLAIDQRRAAARRRSAVLRLGAGAASEVTSPEEVLARRAEAERVLAAVDRLPRRERQVLLLRLAGLNVAETARRLGISAKSVEGAYTRARARVRLLLGGLLGWLADRLRRLASPGGEVVVAGTVAVAAAATTVAALVVFNHDWFIADPPPRAGASSPDPARPPHPASAHAADDGAAAVAASRGADIGPPPSYPPALINVALPFGHTNPPNGKAHNPPPDCQVCLPIDAPDGLASWGIYVSGVDPNAWINCVDQLHPLDASNAC